MARSKLKTVITCQFFFYIFLFLGLFTSVCFAGDGIAPDRNISILQGEPESPEWKVLWDKARNFTREADYLHAVKAYSDLYRIKPNIEEANWEYCKVLLKIEDFSTAEKIIGGLLDKDPNNNDYLLAGGAVAVHRKNYDTAVRYYGRVFEKDPTGQNSDTALLGLATSLRNQGKKKLAFALLEQFSLRHPENNTIIHYLALDADELRKGEKSRNFYAKLLENPEVDDRIIFQAAQVFDVPGYEKKRNTLLLRYLSRHPDYMPFRQKLVQFYIASGAFEKALAQLTYLADNNENNDDFLLAAAKVCLRDLKRPVSALFYFKRYLQKHPNNPEIKGEVAEIQSKLAKEFLVIVENDGAEQLWRDLAEITTTRSAIYYQMADSFEKNEQTKELIEVLKTIYAHSSPENDLALRLAHQHYRIKEYSQALHYLSEVKGKKSTTKSFYLLKGEAERHLGLEIEALASFKQGLLIDPTDLVFRTKCIELAGKLGNANTLIALFNGGLQQSEGEMTPDFVFTYLDLLSVNFLFQEYEKINSWAKFHFAGMPETITRLDIHKASSLRKEGKTRRAEQLLRQLLNNDHLIEDILFQLAENAVIDKNPASAESWYQALLKNTKLVDSNFPYDLHGYRMVLLKANILKAEGKFGTAMELIDDYQLSSQKIQLSEELLPFRERLKVQRCWLSFHKGKLPEAYNQCRELVDNGNFDPELLMLYGILNRRLKKNDQDNALNGIINKNGNPVLSRLLALAAKEIEYLEYESAEKHLRTVLYKYSPSVAGNAMWAELMSARGRGDIADETLSQLSRQFPEEPYFHKKQIEVEAHRGRYEQGLVLMKKDAKETGDVEELATQLAAANEIEELLTLARLLWGDKQQEKALKIYKQLLARPVQEQLSGKFRQHQISYPNLTRENTFWNSMIKMLQSEPKVLDELMEPSFLIENRRNEAGKIVSESFETYSWQKLITNEYMARKAIFDRNYYYAEQSYKRLLKEDSSEGMIDLATVYGKIGKYRKEAQVYKAIQNSGSTTPDLLESIERNTLQISPQSIFNLAYEEKNGRDGSIDMAKTSIGTSFSFTPDLDKDIQFSYANNHFESLDTDQSEESHFLYAVVNYEFTKAYELILGGGTEKLPGDSDDRYQYEIGLKGQLDDYINAHIQFEKRQVYDTIEALRQQLSFQSIETGLSIETPIGLSFGGDLQHRYYSDGNAQNRFHGYSSYTIFHESLQWALRYDYRYLNSEDQNSSLSENSGDEISDDLQYWSPSSFTEHRMGINFQHDFLGYEQGAKKSMSYYAINSALGIEDNENLTFTTKFDIFLEMSPHFLLKGNFTLSKSDEYEEKGLSMSLHYRW
jgi:tetratricopeptide (TPR) repeat protein